MQYEIFYLIGVSLEPELAKIKKEVEETITSVGGKFLEKETVEKRRLSYQVKHETHGIYIAKRFDLEDKEKITKIIKKLNLNNNVLRFVVSKASELPELKSKEERINEAAKKEARAKLKKEELDKKAQDEKEKRAKSKNVKEASTSKKKKETSSATAGSESIDKKLEEILNI